MQLRTATAVTTLCLFGALPGCADDDGGSCSHRVCDIRDPSCIEFVAEVVACQRDAPLVLPEVRFLTASELLGEREDPTEDELRDARDYWAGEALVGLMPAGYDPANVGADSLSGVLAQYHPGPDEIIIITDSNIDDDETAYRVLVHEMIHAHQDAEYDLVALWEQNATTFPRSLGLRAAVEGEAVLLTAFSDIELADFTPEEADWPSYFGSWKQDMLLRAQDSEFPSLDASSLFPYAWGGEQVHQAWEEGGIDGIRDYVQEPPDSVRQVMAGWSERQPKVYNFDTELDPVAVPVLPGHTYLGGGGQDAWLINAMVQRTTASGQLWAAGVQSVEADHLSVWRDDVTGDRVAVWRLRGDTGAIHLLLDSGWTQQALQATTRYRYDVGGDWVLIATETSTAVAVSEAITGWQSQDEATEAAGLARAPAARGLALPQHAH